MWSDMADGALPQFSPPPPPPLCDEPHVHPETPATVLTHVKGMSSADGNALKGIMKAGKKDGGRG